MTNQDYKVIQLKKDLLNVRMTRQRTVVLPASIDDAMQEYAAERGMGVSTFIRNLLAEYTAKQVLQEEGE